MSDYNWCHNPSCHTIETQSRVRGTGDNKVLRTVMIKVGRYNWNRDNTPNIWDYFCNQNCLHQFLGKFAQEVANLNPTPKPKETPIKVKKTKEQDYRMRYNGNDYDKIPYTSTRTTIESINNE